MTKVFLLTYKSASQEDVIERIFATQEEALEYVREKVELEVTGLGHILARTPIAYNIKSFTLQSEKTKGVMFMGKESQISTPPGFMDKVLSYVPMMQEGDVKLSSLRDKGGLTHVTTPSFTNPNVTYGVALDKGGNALGCTCPHFVNRGKECKHMQSVEYQAMMGALV